MASDQTQAPVANQKRLLWAGFTAILAAGTGFALRGGIFDNWAAEFGFTGGQLGAIGGAGFTGFCFKPCVVTVFPCNSEFNPP